MAPTDKLRAAEMEVAAAVVEAEVVEPRRPRRRRPLARREIRRLAEAALSRTRGRLKRRAPRRRKGPDPSHLG